MPDNNDAVHPNKFQSDKHRRSAKFTAPKPSAKEGDAPVHRISRAGAESEILDAGELALRKSQEGLERISRIREDDGLPDLASDMGDMDTLLLDARPLFEAINFQVDEKSTKAAEFRNLIRENLSTEDVGKTLSVAKDTRDLIYTLTYEAMKEIKAFAKFAFRNDRDTSRKALFVSDYNRRRNQRRKREQVAPLPINNDA